MNIDFEPIAVRDVYDGYMNAGYDGVVGYGGALDIRPKFQREFVYDNARQQAVINSILSGFPLNTMYWAKQTDPSTGDVAFEMLDGQQRTMSICEYLEGSFSVIVGGNPKTFDNLSAVDQERILDYKLMVYQCMGDEDEQLAWFEVINIAGLTLRPQELRNAVYTGPWLTDAKRYFSRENQGAHKLAKDYVTAGDVNRQDLLQKAIEWQGGKGDGSVKSYMNAHRKDANANALWTYFKSVIDWAKLIFPTRRAQLRSVPWNVLYEKYGQDQLDAGELEKRVKALMSDDEVQKRSGIYTFVLTGDERALSLRAFTVNQKLEAYEKQNGICPKCGEHYEFEEMDGDHILPWSKGGKTTSENCQMLCIRDNRSGG
ncbi:HNH endonuclease family protein [Agromyces humatus]|uniref:HNH nuclease domain-containing protein n=1 Tax=Agromyces humatus TaxID=279573 RepID=A0ABN2L2S2_9MICO